MLSLSSFPQFSLPRKALTPAPSSSYDSLYGDILDGSATCALCGTDLLEDLLEGSPTAGVQSQRRFMGSEPTVCEQCTSQRGGLELKLMPWNHQDQFEISDTSFYPSPATIADADEGFAPIESMPTKIKALVADLMKHNSTEKRLVSSS